MSKGVRTTQHRPTREGAKSKELNDARQQVKQLTREVARLRRRLEKYTELEEDCADDETEEVTLADIEKPQEVSKEGACKCGANDWVEFCLPSGKGIKICRSCKNRMDVL